MESSSALIDRANNDIAQLIRRFENLIAFSPEEDRPGSNGGSKATAAVAAYQMEVESAALIKAAEDILSLTRVLKEAWLFGKLQTVGTSDAERRTQAASAKVLDELVKLNAEGALDNGVADASKSDGNGS